MRLPVIAWSLRSAGVAALTLTACAATSRPVVHDVAPRGDRAPTLRFDTIRGGLDATAGDTSHVAIALGYTRPGDGGGGTFYWDPGATPDGGIVIGSGSRGGWVR